MNSRSVLYYAVFGWLNDSYTGMEQEDPHVVMVDFQKGVQQAQRTNWNFTIVHGHYSRIGY